MKTRQLTEAQEAEPRDEIEDLRDLVHDAKEGEDWANYFPLFEVYTSKLASLHLHEKATGKFVPEPGSKLPPPWICDWNRYDQNAERQTFKAKRLGRSPKDGAFILRS